MLKQINHPILYQGRRKNSRYFEGWFYKQVTTDCTICVIPGITKGATDTHAFIQTIINTDTATQPETHYHTFPVEQFVVQDDPFCLKIGKNTFTADGMKLDLSDDTYSLFGELSFSPITPIRTSILCPNIMGYFAYLPLMECYHGVISMDHTLSGSLTYNEDRIEFSSGKGYLEKDWGTSFPKDYIWLQSNSFNRNASIMCSIAHIPFVGLSFQGFLCNLTLNGQEYRFATYNTAKLLRCDCTDNQVDITLKKGKLVLDMHAKMSKGGLLKAPRNGSMNAAIKEGLSGEIVVRLSNAGKIVFEGIGNPCGIEVVQELGSEKEKEKITFE